MTHGRDHQQSYRSPGSLPVESQKLGFLNLGVFLKKLNAQIKRLTTQKVNEGTHIVLPPEFSHDTRQMLADETSSIPASYKHATLLLML